MIADILEALTPLLIDLFALLLTIVIGWLGVQANRYLGVQVEARHREALHKALMSGVMRAAELGWDRDAIADEALAYARQSVPDAIRALDAPDSVLRQLAEAKIRQLFKRV
ncbi:MAG: hypothetical protein ACU0B9_07385 [Limimaricola soesokkakensis]|uniref:hypothetical protein n=1 Tax=Limimaricola soesokkakensis TaxID=1343159 RepID=UPI004057D411